jgi:RNA polymerase sigma-70 factor (ECF subfamily)
MATFEELYRQHVQAVFRFALSVAGKREVAEDLTSDAFLALHRNLDGIDQAQLPGWLLTVVRNRARDQWRRQMVERRYADQFAAAPEPEAPPVERWMIESADLKQVHRVCLALRYVQGMTRTEIAARTGLTETQVKGHLQYALILLRKAYGVHET